MVENEQATESMEPLAVDVSTSDSDEIVATDFSDDELNLAIGEVLEQHGGGLGVPKILKQLKLRNPTWKISEKRLRQFMKDRPRAAARPTPVSKNDAKLQDVIKELAPMLEIKRLDQQRGRGLFAKEEIKEGTVIFQEDAWVFVSTGLVRERVREGLGCAHCGKIFQTHKPTSLTCTFHAASPKNAACRNTFCSRTCQAAHTHIYGGYTCSHINPAYAELVGWATETTAPIVVFLIAARIAVAYGRSEKEGAAELAKAEAFTGISERTRREWSATPEEVAEQYGRAWEEGFDFVLRAMHLAAVSSDAPAAEKPVLDGEASHSAVPPQLRLARPLPANAARALLTFDGYLLMHGRVSLNREDDGGLYTLHSSLNHACHPNATLRRVPAKTAQKSRLLTAGDLRPSRIYIHSVLDIPVGTEVTITYVNPAEKVHERRAKLLADYLFTCVCPRCEHELNEERKQKQIIEMIKSLGGGQNVTATQQNGFTVLTLGGDTDNTEVENDLSKVIGQVSHQIET